MPPARSGPALLDRNTSDVVPCKSAGEFDAYSSDDEDYDTSSGNEYKPVDMGADTLRIFFLVLFRELVAQSC